MEEDKTSELFAAGRGESRKALHQGLVIARTCAERPGARQQQLPLSLFLNAPRATSRQGRAAYLRFRDFTTKWSAWDSQSSCVR